MRAIILAAGRGSRMGATGDDRPKCLVELDGSDPADASLRALTLARSLADTSVRSVVFADSAGVPAAALAEYGVTDVYVIEPSKCTECVGHFDEPQCRQVCPVECIPLNPEHVESPSELLAKYQRLTANKG